MSDLILTAAGLAITVVISMTGTAWGLSRHLQSREDRFVKMMVDHEKADTDRFAAVNSQIAAAVSTLVGQFGDTGRALREHMHLIQLDFQKGKVDNLETFIRRDSFYPVVENFTAQLNRVEDGVNTRMGEMNVKIDNISKRGSQKSST